MRRVLLFLVGSIMILWAGCSVEKNYELLSTFFDGVPDPNAPSVLDRDAIVRIPTHSEHPPYIQDACLECHTDPSDMVLSKSDSSMCLKCHKDIVEQFEVMHGAVTGIACLRCHNPHISSIPHLLRDDGPKMCLQCHELDAQSATTPHTNLDRRCIDCHFGHGGEELYFLREQIIPSQIGNEEQSKEVDGT